MAANLLLYTRKDCCLCEEMKEVVRRVALEIPLEVEELDVDSSAELSEKYGEEVPVLFVNGRKSFKFRVTEKELRRRLGR